jgi:hypothetical protein
MKFPPATSHFASFATATITLFSTACAQGHFSAKNFQLGAQGAIYSRYGQILAPATTTGVAISYQGRILGSGTLAIPGYFALGVLTVPDPPTNVITVFVEVWDKTQASSYDTATSDASASQYVNVQLTDLASTPMGLSQFKAMHLGDSALIAAPQTIDQFTTSPTRVTAGQSATLSAVATSGLPIFWSVISGPATVVGNVLYPTQSGTVVIQAWQPGNQNGYPVGDPQSPRYYVPVTATFSIDVAPSGPPVLKLAQPPGAGLQLGLFAAAGANVQIQTSPDLVHWTNSSTAVGAGLGSPVSVPTPSAPVVGTLFWRVLE